MKAYALDLPKPLRLTMAMSEGTMRQRIEEHCITNNFEAPLSEITTGPVKEGVKMVELTISPGIGKEGTIPVLVGHQGKAYTLPRGIKLTVPFFIAKVLEDAVQDIVTQDLDGELYHTPAATYPYTVSA